jgi:addiction module HigA family antidote
MTPMFLFDGASNPPAPGEVLKQKLIDGLGLTQAELARYLQISSPRLNMILKGRCPLSAEIALRIEKVFGISPQEWLRIRADFELFEGRRRISKQLDQLARHTSSHRENVGSWQISGWQAAA